MMGRTGTQFDNLAMLDAVEDFGLELSLGEGMHAPGAGSNSTSSRLDQHLPYYLSNGNGLLYDGSDRLPEAEGEIERAITASFDSLRSFPQSLLGLAGLNASMDGGGMRTSWIGLDGQGEELDGAEEDRIYEIPFSLTEGISTALSNSRAPIVELSEEEEDQEEEEEEESIMTDPRLIESTNEFVPAVPLAAHVASSHQPASAYIPSLSRPRASHMTKSYVDENEIDDMFESDTFGRSRKLHRKRSEVEETEWEEPVEEWATDQRKSEMTNKYSLAARSAAQDLAAQQLASEAYNAHHQNQAYDDQSEYPSPRQFSVPEYANEEGIVSSYNPNSFPMSDYSMTHAASILHPPHNHNHDHDHDFSDDDDDYEPDYDPPSTSNHKKSDATARLRASTAMENRRRSEIPAVEHDHTITPYGCNYPDCLASALRVAGLDSPPRPRNRGKARAAAVVNVNKRPRQHFGEEPVTSFRTIKELREHCAAHRKANDWIGNQHPFRCSLDPCGKTFKVRFSLPCAST